MTGLDILWGLVGRLSLLSNECEARTSWWEDELAVPVELLCVLSDDAQLAASVVGLAVSSAADPDGCGRKLEEGSESVVVSIVIVGLQKVFVSGRSVL